MTELQKAFLTVYEPVMLGKGFMKKRMTFHKLVNNQIIQMLSYTKISFSFSIQFDISALCSGMEQNILFDAERLCDHIDHDAEWDCDGSDYIRQMRESLAICETKLFPLFEKIKDYQSYYKYEIEQHGIRLNRMTDLYRKINADILEVPNSISFFTLSLLTGDYQSALKSREAVIKQNESAIKENYKYAQRLGIKYETPPKKLINLDNRRNDYLRIKEAIDNNDREYIEAYVKEKERYSLESYIQNFYGKKAFQTYQQTGQWPL